VRLVLCGLVVLAGAGLAVATFGAGENAFVMALASGALLAIGILAGSPLFVPPLLRGLGALARLFGPIPRLAANNASRNASRSAATATALMLAVGLVVTLQVATATTKAAMLDQISASNPLDISVRSVEAGIPADTVAKLQSVQGIASSVALQGGSADTLNAHQSLRVLRYDPDVERVLSVPSGVGPGRAVVGLGVLGGGVKSGDVTLTGANGATARVRATAVEYLDNEILVDAKTFSALVDKPVVASVWLKATERTTAASTYAGVTDIVGKSGLVVGGSLAYAAMITQTLDALLLIATILSAVAIVISLIGVGNTLGLSVLERTRESALLRALGLQKRGLRASLTIEALLIGVLGVAVGALAGMWFGWFASAALMVTSAVALPALAVDPATTGVLVLVALAAAVGSSVLPGRRAALAAPVEALADVD
jgi:putative ABC transport system permease protein